MPPAQLPPLSAVAGALLRSAAGEEVKAASLWASSPVLIFALRRPGCVLCRDTAKKVRVVMLLRGGRKEAWRSLLQLLLSEGGVAQL
jgi:hypothetical protein